jgi:hypothetical protein
MPHFVISFYMFTTNSGGADTSNSKTFILQKVMPVNHPCGIGLTFARPFRVLNSDELYIPGEEGHGIWSKRAAYR